MPTASKTRATFRAVRRHGVIDLPTIQKKINFHYSVTLDLFGSEISTNAANAFNAGIKGRFHEDQIDDDHQLQGATYRVLQGVDGRFEWIDAPALSAINARLRDDYIVDCEPVLKAWNRVISDAGIDFQLRLPHRAFHRKVGDFSELVGNAVRRHCRCRSVAAFCDGMVTRGIGSRIRVVVDAAVPFRWRVRAVDRGTVQRCRRQAGRLRVRETRFLMRVSNVSVESYNAADALLLPNRAHASRVAVIDDAGSYTYAEIEQRANRFANLLRARGLTHRERVLLCLEDSVDFPVCFLGAMRAGAVPVPLNTLLTAKDYAYIVADSEAKLLVVSAALLPAWQTVFDSPCAPRHARLG